MTPSAALYPGAVRSRADPTAQNAFMEDQMPTFILSLNWTDQGIRGVKEAPKRSKAARDLAKKLGVEIKQVYLTSGENDLLLIVESASGDNVAKFALATGSLGNVRTKTARAWSESEFGKLLSELP
jgi:uncharacterized protein with GYD domain